MCIFSPIGSVKFLSRYQKRADFPRYAIALKLHMHCTGIYRDANLPPKSAYFVAAMYPIHHRDAVYPLCKGRGVIVISIQCIYAINQ